MNINIQNDEKRLLTDVVWTDIKKNTTPSNRDMENVKNNFQFCPKETRFFLKNLVSRLRSYFLHFTIEQYGLGKDPLNDFNKLKTEIQGFVKETLQILDKWLPQDLFTKYCQDQGSDVEHDITHALDVLSLCCKILQCTSSSERKIDWRLLTYGALLHDISNITSRYEHHTRSAQWARVLLDWEMREIKPICLLTDNEIKKICDIIIGHKKIGKPQQMRPEHEHPEACILHDADMISSCREPEKIYLIKRHWSIKDSNQKYNTSYTIYSPHPPLPINQFYKREETFPNRKDVIQNNLDYTKSDGVTDLFVKIIWRRSQQYYSKYYLTPEAQEYIKKQNRSDGIDINFLTNYIEKKRDLMIKHYADLTNADIDEIKNILNRLNDDLKPVL